MIVYDPLWETLKSKGITTYKLIEQYGFSSHTVHRLKLDSEKLNFKKY